jgi:hypothetical protein
MPSWNHMAALVTMLACCQAIVLAQNQPGSLQKRPTEASRDEAGHKKTAVTPAPANPANPAGHGTGPITKPARQESTQKKAAAGEAAPGDRGTCMLGAIDCTPTTQRKR